MFGIAMFSPTGPFFRLFVLKGSLISSKTQVHKTLTYTLFAKNYVYMTKSVTLAPLGPFLKCPTLITHDVLITFCDRLVNVRGVQTTFSERSMNVCGYQGNNSSKTEIFNIIFFVTLTLCRT